MSKNTTKPTPVKPKKPYPGFPLFPHATRRWAKKIRGRLHYFGPWADPDAALQKYLYQRDALHAGRTPRTSPKGLTVRELVNRFMTSKKVLLGNAEIVQRTFDDYYVVCRRVVGVFGPDRLVVDLAAEDFAQLRAAFAKTRGPVSLTNDITRARSVFKFGFDEGLIDRPIRYGQSFKRPSRRIIRQARNANGGRMFEPVEIRALLDKATPQMRTMILLAANCAFGNHDCGSVPISAVDLDRAWISFPRPKTATPRRAPLWPETAQALREWLAVNPKPLDDVAAKLVFRTAKGASWAKSKADNPVAKEFAKLQREAGTYRKGRGFYSIRHVFQTVGDDAGDPLAVRFIMGYTPAAADMSAIYRERISDTRLKAVTDHVRRWLFEDVDQNQTKE